MEAVLKYSYRSGIQKFKIKLINLSTALIFALTGLSGAAPLLVTGTAHADAPVDGVVINEFSANSSPDWVELYNTTDAAVSLNGWKLNDETSKIADLSGDIAGHGFAKVDVGERLNTDGDTITLFHSQNRQTSVAYGTASGAIVTAPGDNQSAARVPDGSSTWQVTYTPTPNTSNNPSLTLTNLLPKSGENYADYANGYGFTVDALNVNDKVANDTVTLTITPDKSGLQNATYSAPGRKGGPGSETFGEAPTIDQIMQDTGMQLGDTFTVTASADDPYGHTATTSSTQVQLGTTPVVAATAVVNTRTNETFDSVQAALADSDMHDGDTIALNADLTTPSFIKITRPIVLDGNGHTITATNTVTSSVFDIWSTTGVTISDLIVDGNGVYVRGINAYNATVALNNVTLKNNGKDGLVVNGSNVTVSDITTIGNGWDGIDVDKAGAILTVNGTSKHTEVGNAIYVDDTTTGAKVVDTNNQYTSKHIDKHGEQPYDLAYNLKPADITPPSVPTLLSPVNRGYEKTNDFYFDWTDTTDANPGVTYEFQSSQNPHTTNGVLDNGIWNSIANGQNLTESKIHSTGAPDGDWYWQVRAIDAAGNKSAWTAPWKMTIDTRAPEGTITAPITNDYVNTRQTGNVLTIKGTAKDDLSLNRVLVQLLTSKHGAILNKTVYLSGTSDDWQAAFNTKDMQLADGQYAVVASFVDNAGNVYKTNYVDFTLDNTKPTIEFVDPSPADGAWENGNFDVTFHAHDNYKLKYVTVGLRDNTKAAKDQWKAGCNFNNLDEDDVTNTCNITLPADLPDGTYTIQIGGQDQAGLYAVGKTQTVHIDRTAPTDISATYTGGLGNVTSPTPVTGKVLGGNLTFQISENEANPSYMYAEVNWLNPVTNKWEKHSGWGNAITSNSDTISLLANAPSGTYQIKVSRISDKAGNTATTQTFNFTVDNTTPTGTATYTGGNTDNGIIYLHSIDDLKYSVTLKDNQQLDQTSFVVFKLDANDKRTGAYCGNWTNSDTTEHVSGTSASVSNVPVNKCTWRNGGSWTDGTYEIDHIVYDSVKNETKFNAPAQKFILDSVAPTFTLTDDGNPQQPITDGSFVNPAKLGDRDNNGNSIRFTKQSATDILYVNDTPIFNHGYFNKGTSGQIGAAFKNEGTYTVYTKDLAGNKSGTITFTVDTTRPDLSFVAPTDFSTPFTAGPEVKVKAFDPNGLSVLVVHVYDNTTGKLLASPMCTAIATDLADGTLTCDLSGLPDGTYYIKAGTNDTAGNNQTVTSATFTVDGTAPVITDDQTVSLKTGDQTTLKPTVADPNTPLTYLWTVSDQKLLQGDPHQSMTGSSLEIGSAPADTYTVTLVATDAFGNSSTPFIYMVTVTAGNSFGRGGAAPVFSPDSKPKTLGVTTAASSAVSDVTTAPAGSAPEVKGASTDKPNTDTVATTTSKPDKDAAKTASAFLGLGWWWLLVLVVIAGLLWTLLGRSTNRTDKTA
jgi:hypothetical protein